MRIAILAWGSLLWDEEGNREFDKWRGDWEFDGPSLRIEFSRISKSRKDALTLVIDPENGVPTIVAWCPRKRKKLGDGGAATSAVVPKVRELLALLACCIGLICSRSASTIVHQWFTPDFHERPTQEQGLPRKCSRAVAPGPSSSRAEAAFSICHLRA